MFTLLKTPFLAQEIIFKSMEIHEIFFLSTLSKRIKYSISKAKLHKKSAGIRLKFAQYHLEEQGCVAFSNGPSIISWQMLNEFDTGRIGGQRKWTNMKINGFTFRFTLIHLLGTLKLYISRSNSNIPFAIAKHCAELFGESENIDAHITMSKFHGVTRQYTIKHLICNSDYGHKEGTDLDNFFNSVHVTDTVQIMHIIQTHHRSDTKMIKTSHLQYRNGCFGLDQLRGFTGKNLLATSSVINADVLNLFVKGWVNGRNESLETVNCLCTMSLGSQTVLDGIPTEKWNPEKRAGIYLSKNGTPNFITEALQSGNNDFTEECHDFERKSDGLLATVKIQDTRFVMVVWHDRFPVSSG